MKPLFKKGKNLRQPKVRVKKLKKNYAKLNHPDSYFITYLEGFYIFFSILNFDLPIPRRGYGRWSEFHFTRNIHGVDL